MHFDFFPVNAKRRVAEFSLFMHGIHGGEAARLALAHRAVRALGRLPVGDLLLETIHIVLPPHLRRCIEIMTQVNKSPIRDTFFRADL